MLVFVRSADGDTVMKLKHNFYFYEGEAHRKNCITYKNAIGRFLVACVCWWITLHCWFYSSVNAGCADIEDTRSVMMSDEMEFKKLVSHVDHSTQCIEYVSGKVHPRFSGKVFFLSQARPRFISYEAISGLIR